MQPVYLLVGVPGVGKSWVCSQLKDKYEHLPHDDFESESSYIKAASRLREFATKPVLLETPFSISKYTDALPCTLVFVLAEPDHLKERWDARKTVQVARQGHLTRQTTYRGRAEASGSFKGNSNEVLNYLKGLV